MKALKLLSYFMIVLPLSVLLLGELAFIAQHFYKFNTFSDSRSLEPDPVLGWRARENFSLSYQTKDFKGNPYQIDYKTTVHGFKVWGDVQTQKKKVLVMGDSFTQARQVSNDKTYYAYFDPNDYEVFAYGAGGFGTYQEYLVLDQYWDRIKPDIVIWQFCRNDLGDNDYLIDKASSYSGIILDRPYIDFKRSQKDSIYQKTHYIWPSRFLEYVFSRLLNLTGKRDVYKEIESLMQKSEDLERSFLTTEQILKKVRERIGKVPVIAFGVDSHPVYRETFRSLSESARFTYLDSIARTIESAEKSGTSVRALDGGHWNEEGHRLAGQLLADQLKLLDKL